MLASRLIKVVAIVLLAFICFKIYQINKDATSANDDSLSLDQIEMRETQRANNVGGIFLWYASAALVGGFLLISWIVPMLGEAVGTATFSSGEEVAPDPYLKARGKVAIGDYEGAIGFFQEAIEANPEDRRSISEIANLCVDKLRDPGRAIGVLEQAIHGQWSDDDMAYFLFKLADLHGEFGLGKERVVTLLQDVIQRFPDSRHSANAIHRLREIDPALVAMPGSGSLHPPPSGGPGPSVPTPPPNPQA